jgi:hypothetical protein
MATITTSSTLTTHKDYHTIDDGIARVKENETRLTEVDSDDIHVLAKGQSAMLNVVQAEREVQVSHDTTVQDAPISFEGEKEKTPHVVTLEKVNDASKDEEIAGATDHNHAATTIERLRSDVEEKRQKAQEAKDTHAKKLSAAQVAILTSEKARRDRIEHQASVDEAKRKAEEDMSLAAFRQALFEKRREKQEAAERHDQKVIEAVCAASLLEYTERERLEKRMHDEEIMRQHAQALEKEQATQRVLAARQAKLDALCIAEERKQAAEAMAAKARLAIHAFQQQECDRQTKLIEIAETNAQLEAAIQLEAARQRQETASSRRMESERRAAEAKEKVQQLREQAIAAAKNARAVTKQHMHAVLESEEVARVQSYQQQLSVLEREKVEATRMRMEKEQRAKELKEKAEKLVKELGQSNRISSSQSRNVTLDCDDIHITDMRGVLEEEGRGITTHHHHQQQQQESVDEEQHGQSDSPEELPLEQEKLATATRMPASSSTCVDAAGENEEEGFQIEPRSQQLKKNAAQKKKCSLM